MLSNLTDANNLLALKTELALLPSPKIYGGTGNIVLTTPITNQSLNEILDKTKGMRLMGQRFVPDSYIFQHLVFPEVGDYLDNQENLPFTAGFNGTGGLSRMYVRGLDAMAVIGSNEALKLLIEEGDTRFLMFWQQFGELKDEFDALDMMDWNRNLYLSWLYTLKALLSDVPDGYPRFMRTEAWRRRELNAALASWTQLRHDTILYSKPSHVAYGGMVESPPPGYIEPIPVFWGRLLSQVQMTSQGLDNLNVLSSEMRVRFTELAELLQRILLIVAKELTNEQFSSEDHEFIKALPITLKSIINSEDEISIKPTLVADVYVNPYEGMVIEEATGKIDLIVVACPMPDGKTFLAAGPIFSYYEFKYPMSDRLTDKAWQKLLDSPQKPNRPQWYVRLMGS